MPVSVLTARDPFRGPPPATKPDEPPLFVPQARVLRALMPAYPEDPPFEWPLLTRVVLCQRAGFTIGSGSITRALNGIRPGNRTSGTPHPGVIGKGLVEIIEVDVDGRAESNYRITRKGIRALGEYLKTNGDKLPPVKDASTCTNDRYQHEDGE